MMKLSEKFKVGKEVTHKTTNDKAKIVYVSEHSIVLEYLDGDFSGVCYCCDFDAMDAWRISPSERWIIWDKQHSLPFLAESHRHFSSKSAIDDYLIQNINNPNIVPAKLSIEEE